MKATFGQRVRELRMAKGLSQEALALACDLDRSYISGGSTRPSAPPSGTTTGPTPHGICSESRSRPHFGTYCRRFRGKALFCQPVLLDNSRKPLHCQAGV
ncbi:MAG: hypothetical protein DMG59_26930 [Acidobacteria bacterium]|nr:MAG: hypothetical protein DMG59_26930 [Acidobacteriota bacterium]